MIASGTPGELTSTRAQNTISFRAPSGLDTAPLVSALPPDCTVTESPAGSYRVEGLVNPQVLAAVTAWCAEQA